MPFDLGDTVRLTATCTDPGGTPATAATAVLTITLPDGTAATPAVPAPAAAGQYTVDYPTEQPGRHAVRWLFTDPGAAFTDAFDVREAIPPMLFSLADGKRHVQLPQGDTSEDDEVREWIEATTLCVEHLVGVCVPRQVTETHNLQPSGVEAFALALRPVLSLTSVTAIRTGRPGYDVDGLDVDENGIVIRLDGGRFTGRLRVVYTPGRQIIPANIRDGGRLILQHLWRTRRAGRKGGVAGSGGDDYSVTEPIPGLGYAIPNRAMQLLDPDRLPPGNG